MRQNMSAPELAVLVIIDFWHSWEAVIRKQRKLQGYTVMVEGLHSKFVDAKLVLQIESMAGRTKVHGSKND
jgi:lysophospholipid acyltransferase (LPLAT)-like uncharacterized protein